MLRTTRPPKLERPPAPKNKAGGGSVLDMLSGGFMSGFPGLSTSSAARSDAFAYGQQSAVMSNDFVFGGSGGGTGGGLVGQLSNTAVMLALVGVLAWVLTRRK